MHAMILCLLAAAAADGPAVREEPGLVFGKAGDTELKLDLVMPAAGDGPFPAVVCVHGGGWVEGDRTQMAQTLQALARRGYVAVSPDYRLAKQARFPAAVEDCKAAVRWLRANAQAYKIDPDHIGAVGFSSGAHLALMLGVTDKSDGLEGDDGNPDQSSRVQAVVSFFGPTDLAAKDFNLDVQAKNLLPFLGGSADEKPDLYRKASPITYAGKNTAPLMIFHGGSDKIVPVDQSRKLADKVVTAGGWAHVIVLEGEGHGFRPEKLLPCVGQMMGFLDGQLKKTP